MKLTEHNEKVLQQFSEMMIERMQQVKAENWQQGWLGTTKGGTPMNIEGNAYRGGNVFMLMLDCAMQSYEFPIYCTLRQTNRLGAHVNKGEKAMPVIYWDFTITTPDGCKIAVEEYRQLSETGRKACKALPFLKSYHVFNIQQTNLAEVQPDKTAKLKERFKPVEFSDEKGMYANATIDAMLKNQSWLCPIQYDKLSDGAFYSTQRDLIVMPMKKQFKRHRKPELVYLDGQEYYSTLLHEMIHSTAAFSHLNRHSGTRFGSAQYAKEELIAELGAARISWELGFDGRIRDNSASYLDSWIATLRQEPTFILTIMIDVEKSSRMIFDRLAA